MKLGDLHRPAWWSWGWKKCNTKNELKKEIQKAIQEIKDMRELNYEGSFI
jgi:hypothetical protein